MSKLKILMIITIVGIISFVTGCSNDKKEGNVWLVDSTAPTSSIEAKNGDMYLDTSTYDLYQMTNDEWIKIGNISGKDGADGKDATEPTISIDKNGYWIINGNTTGIKATGVNGKDGADGKDGIDGVNGKDGANGKDGIDGVNGKDGADGKDGIDGVNGKDGADGKDGIDGVNGKDGADGKDGITPTVTINKDGYWVINGETTTIKAGNKIVCAAVTSKTKTTGNVPAGNYEQGDEYICEVADGVTYNFFVLGINEDDSTKVNLLMERNMCEDGTVATANNNCTVKWYSDLDSSYGPVTAMTYLYNATKSWNNIKGLNFEYDETVENTSATGYKSMISVDGVATITSSKSPATTVTLGTETETLKARLPMLSEFNKICKSDIASCPIWLANYLSEYTGADKYPNNDLSGITGYWLLSSYGTDYRAWAIHAKGGFTQQKVNVVGYGVRPVITVSKANFSN